MRKISLCLVVVLLFTVASNAAAGEPDTARIHDFYRGFGKGCLEVSNPGVQVVGEWGSPYLIYYGWTLIDLEPGSEVYISLYDWQCVWWHCEAVKEVGDGQSFVLEGGSYLIIGGEEPVADHVEVLRLDVPLPCEPDYIEIGPREQGRRTITAHRLLPLETGVWYFNSDDPYPTPQTKQVALTGEIVAEVYCLTFWQRILRGQFF